MTETKPDVVAMLRPTALGWWPTLADLAVLAVACPYCHLDPGHPCLTNPGCRPRQPHAARWKALWAKIAEMEENQMAERKCTQGEGDPALAEDAKQVERDPRPSHHLPWGWELHWKPRHQSERRVAGLWHESEGDRDRHAAAVWADWRRGWRKGEGLRLVILPEGEVLSERRGDE